MTVGDLINELSRYDKNERVAVELDGYSFDKLGDTADDCILVPLEKVEPETSGFRFGVRIILEA